MTCIICLLESAKAMTDEEVLDPKEEVTTGR